MPPLRRNKPIKFLYYVYIIIENEMKDVLCEIVLSIGAKLNDIWSSCTGVVSFLSMWLMALLATVFGFYKEVIIITFFCIFIDLIWGVAKSVKMGGYATSYLLKNTIIKIGAYFSVMMLLISAEHLLHIDSQVFTITFTIVILVTELISILGNIAIVKPSLIFVKILRRLVTGEVARKLNITDEEAKKLLEI